jgi:hypothetical protein
VGKNILQLKRAVHSQLNNAEDGIWLPFGNRLAGSKYVMGSPLVGMVPVGLKVKDLSVRLSWMPMVRSFSSTALGR